MFANFKTVSHNSDFTKCTVLTHLLYMNSGTGWHVILALVCLTASSPNCPITGVTTLSTINERTAPAAPAAFVPIVGPYVAYASLAFAARNLPTAVAPAPARAAARAGPLDCIKCKAAVATEALMNVARVVSLIRSEESKLRLNRAVLALTALAFTPLAFTAAAPAAAATSSSPDAARCI